MHPLLHEGGSITYEKTEEGWLVTVFDGDDEVLCAGSGSTPQSALRDAAHRWDYLDVETREGGVRP